MQEETMAERQYLKVVKENRSLELIIKRRIGRIGGVQKVYIDEKSGNSPKSGVRLISLLLVR